MSRAMGHLLRQWREQRGWSREQLVDVICSNYSNQVGSGKGGFQISERTIQRGESGESSPTIRKLSIWLGALQGIPEERLDSFFSNLLNFVFSESKPPSSSESIEASEASSDDTTWSEPHTAKWANIWWHKLMEFISEYHEITPEMKQFFVQEHPKPVANFFKAVSLQRALNRKKEVPNEAILLVDDEVHVLRVLSDALSDRYEVVIASSAYEALDLLKTDPVMERVGVIVSDQRMPHMSGVDFLKASNDYLPQAKKILMSAYTDMNAVIDSINKLQIFRFLQKPFAPSELQLAIEEAYHRYYEKKNNHNLVQKLATLTNDLNTQVAAQVKIYQQQNLMVRTRSRSKDRFWHTIVRDLRVPLQTFQSSHKKESEPVEDSYPNTSSEVGSTPGQWERLDRFLVQALHWSQQNAREKEVQSFPSNLMQVTQQAYNLVADAAQEKNLRVVFEIALSLHCLVDEAMLCTVLSTLLSKTIQGSPELGEIRIIATEEKEYLQIIINDTNLEPLTFFWEHPFTSSSTEPMDPHPEDLDSRFQIHLCRRSLQSHGGNLFFQHDARKGSTIILSVPKAPVLLPNEYKHSVM